MENSFKYRLLDYAKTPTNKVWNGINAALEADEEIILSNKLFSFEEVPPSNAWNEISKALQNNLAIPFYKKHRTIFTYSGAAAAILVLVFALNLIFNKPAEGDIAQTPLLNNELKKGQPSQNNILENIVPEENTTYTIASTKKIIKNKRRKNTEQIAALQLFPNSTTEHLKEIVAGRPNISDLSSNLERYIVSLNSSGDAAKLPKKMYDFISCPNEYTKEDCKKELQSIQQKVAKPALIASADFTGVLELLKSLQENK